MPYEFVMNSAKRGVRAPKKYAHSLSARDARTSLRTRSTEQMANLEDKQLFEKSVRSGARSHSKTLLQYKTMKVRAHFSERMYGPYVMKASIVTKKKAKHKS